LRGDGFLADQLRQHGVDARVQQMTRRERADRLVGMPVRVHHAGIVRERVAGAERRVHVAQAGNGTILGLRHKRVANLGHLIGRKQAAGDKVAVTFVLPHVVRGQHGQRIFRGNGHGRVPFLCSGRWL
jgi:hypothetical protein